MAHTAKAITLFIAIAIATPAYSDDLVDAYLKGHSDGYKKGFWAGFANAKDGGSVVVKEGSTPMMSDLVETGFPSKSPPYMTEGELGEGATIQYDLNKMNPDAAKKLLNNWNELYGPPKADAGATVTLELSEIDPAVRKALIEAYPNLETLTDTTLFPNTTKDDQVPENTVQPNQ